MGHQWRGSDGDRVYFFLVLKPKIAACPKMSFQVNDRVEVYLDAKYGERQGWYEGIVFRIDPYSEHRSFYWVQLSLEAQAALGMRQISVFNPKNIRKLDLQS